MIAGQFRQVAAILFQGVVGVLRAVAGHAGRAAHGGQGLQKSVLGDIEGAENLLHRPLGAVQDAQHQVLHADIFILHAGRFLGGLPQCLVHVRGHVHLARLPGAAGDPGQLFDLRKHCRAQGGGVHVHLGQQLGDQPVGALGEGRQQMQLAQLLVAVFARQGLGVLDGLHAFLRILIAAHNIVLPSKINFDLL